MSDSNSLIAYEIYSVTNTPLEPAPITRDWMDAAHQRHPYRCLPLVIANQSGWVLRSTTLFRACWYGGPTKHDLEIQFDHEPDDHVVSHFGSGVITFNIPFLFRTPPGINLWVKGPANWIKDAVQPLEGIVETDWVTSTFTMNWKITRICKWIRFEKDEPYCMLVPIPRALGEDLFPRREPLFANPELKAQYDKWEVSRKGFLTDLSDQHPDAVKAGWQKDYFQGKTPDGKPFETHKTKVNLREFEQKRE
jgi:hypothetical protein